MISKVDSTYYGLNNFMNDVGFIPVALAVCLAALIIIFIKVIFFDKDDTQAKLTGREEPEGESLSSKSF